MTPAITNTGRRAIPMSEDHVAKANSDDGNFRKLLSPDLWGKGRPSREGRACYLTAMSAYGTFRTFHAH
jgi:hypothetical protein